MPWKQEGFSEYDIKMKTGSGSSECWPSRLDRILLSKMCYWYKAAAALGQSVQDLGKLKSDEIPAWGEGGR